MIAVPLIYGALTAEHYEDHIANNTQIDLLRDKMQVIEEAQFSKDYLDPEKRSIANAIQIIFKDGTKTDDISIEYPIGHKRRRTDGIPLLLSKFKAAVYDHYPEKQAISIIETCLNQEKLGNIAADEWISQLQK
jgi:2-methylcitrate dehydratase PrpD